MTLTVRQVGERELQECPAAIMVGGGEPPTLLINTRHFLRLEPFARRFVVAHELGHWLLATSDETLADAFALGLVAGSERRSLKKSLQTLLTLDITPPRFNALVALCLAMDRNKKINP